MKQSPEKGHFLLGHSHRPPSSSHHGTVGKPHLLWTQHGYRLHGQVSPLSPQSECSAA